MAFKTENDEKYNWLKPSGATNKSDQHFGVAVGSNPVEIFHDGPYETLAEGCYRKQPCTGSDDL